MFERGGNEIESGEINTKTPIVKLKLGLQNAGCFWEMGDGEGLDG